MHIALDRFVARACKSYKRFYTRHPSLHTPRVDVVFPESVDRYLELQCNSDKVLYTNMPEARHLETYLGSVQPGRVLEIGAGIGRASVYLAQRFQWTDTAFHILDGDSGDKQYSPIDGARRDRFYNSLEATRVFCTANGIPGEKLVFHNAENDQWQSEIAGLRFDLIYSFAAIGFHWSIHMYLDQLRRQCHPDTLLIFGMRGTDRGAEFTDSQVRDLNAGRWKIVANQRDSELDRSSILVLQAA